LLSFTFFFQIFMYWGGTVRFAPVVPWAKAGPGSLLTEHASSFFGPYETKGNGPTTIKAETNCLRNRVDK
jgi:hypothetical protein